jgi:hypothetical protein
MSLIELPSKAVSTSFGTMVHGASLFSAAGLI